MVPHWSFCSIQYKMLHIPLPSNVLLEFVSSAWWNCKQEFKGRGSFYLYAVILYPDKYQKKKFFVIKKILCFLPSNIHFNFCWRTVYQEGYLPKHLANRTSLCVKIFSIKLEKSLFFAKSSQQLRLSFSSLSRVEEKEKEGDQKKGMNILWFYII